MIKTNNVYNGDALILMDKMIEDGTKVDAIITDPPYNIARDNNFETMGRSSIDFGEWDKGFDQYSWIDKAYELIDRGGSLFLFNDWKNVGEIARYAESIGFEIKDMVRWRKSNPIPRNRDRRYITDFECAIWLVKKGAKWTFNRLNDTYDRCEYEYAVTSTKERFEHPTAKPVALMEEIVKRHTNEGDLVLDPFIGSGSTIVACQNLQREYIGFELDKKYYNIAKERVSENLQKIRMACLLGYSD